LLDIDPAGAFHRDWSQALVGVVASIPLLLGLWGALRSRAGPVRQLVDLVQEQLGPLLAPRSMAELAGIAILAGVAEELLFRGLLQAGLSRVLPDIVALAIASAVFGLAHFLTPAYAVLAFVAGAYLGGLFLLQGNLLPPIVAHALYDFVAFICLVRRHRTGGKPE
jgi:membrane protease YdiL (CAAX protease family)